MGKRKNIPSKRVKTKKTRKSGGKGWLGCLWVCVGGIVVTAVLGLVLYLAFPTVFFSVFNRVVGTYKPEKGEKYDGIDVSHNNGKIDWDKVAGDPNIRFVYIKATEGYKFKDKKYEYNHKNARRVGIKAGAYHVLTTRTSMATQFNYFKQVANRDNQGLVPMVDLEESKLRKWSKAQVQDSLTKFLTMIEDYYCARPVIYCSYRYYEKNLSPRFDDYILFLARYGKQEPILRNKSHDIWQFTEHGSIDGITGDVDLDRFGDDTSLSDILY